MPQEFTKTIAQKLMKIEGEVRGIVLKTDGEYILKEKGEVELKKIEQELESIGYPIKYKTINAMDFYPVGLRILSLLTIQKLFHFDDEKIKEMGFYAAKVSLIVKIFVKYFISVQRVFFKESPRMWKEHWSIGELVPIELNEEKKYAILKLINFNFHPLYCNYLRGYFIAILQMLIKSSQITCEETKCSFRGDEYHEYSLKWL